MGTRGTSPESAANFRMIDIGEKAETSRRALASGSFFAAPDTLSRILSRSLPKGDVLALAEVAGIQGAKKTSDLLPLCHPLPLTSVRVWTEAEASRIRVYCEAKTVGKTGVEMEALCGVSSALLCLYDLTKGVDPALGIGEIRLELKEGGKSGKWVHPESGKDPAPTPRSPSTLSETRSAVLTLSDRCARKEYEDLSGPAAARWLKERGAVVMKTAILPDEKSALRECLEGLLSGDPLDLIVTSGGTGLSPRDITPETVEEMARERGGREVPGIGELLRGDGARHTRNSWLSRSSAFLIRDTLIVCLPGSPAAVTQGLDAVGDLIRHALRMSSGGKHEVHG